MSPVGALSGYMLRHCVIKPPAAGGRVTAAETRRGTEIIIHAVYPQLSYVIHRMPRYFGAFAALWRSCLGLIDYRYHGLSPETEDEARTESQMVLPTQKGTPELVVYRMSIASPMEITFALQGGGTLIGAYAACLFARALRSPESIGSWLPRLVAGWHQGWHDVEHQKLVGPTGRMVSSDDLLPIPEQVREVRELVDASVELLQLDMKADEVITTGVDELSADLADPNVW
jgi:hypothetical protein